MKFVICLVYSLLVYIMFCTAKTKLPASIWTDTKQQKKTDVKKTPVRTQPPRTASKNQALPSPDSNGLASPPPSPCHMRKIMAPQPPAMARIPLPPGRQQQTQATTSSNNDSEMIARLISEKMIRLCMRS